MACQNDRRATPEIPGPTYHINVRPGIEAAKHLGGIFQSVNMPDFLGRPHFRNSSFEGLPSPNVPRASRSREN
jgi:hypothetical protein